MEFIFLDICGLLCYVISCETNVMSLKFRRLCSSSEKRSACLHLLALLHALLKSDSVCEDNYRLGSTLTMEVPVSLKCRYISTRIHGAMQNMVILLSLLLIPYFLHFFLCRSLFSDLHTFYCPLPLPFSFAVLTLLIIIYLEMSATVWFGDRDIVFRYPSGTRYISPLRNVQTPSESTQPPFHWVSGPPLPRGKAAEVNT